MVEHGEDTRSDRICFAYIADGWTTGGERLDSGVYVVEADGRLRAANSGERAAFYRDHWPRRH